MIAYVLRETGRDPAWLIGAPVPQLGATRARGRVARRRGRRVRPLGLLAAAEIAVVTNVELDHHTESASVAELEAAFAAGRRGRAEVVRDAPPSRASCRCRASTTGERGAALAALEARACPAWRWRRRSRGSPARDGASRLRGGRRDHRRRLRPPPEELAATIAAGARRTRAGGSRPLPAAPLLAYAAPRRELGAALARPTTSRWRRLSGARGSRRRASRQACRGRALGRGVLDGWMPRSRRGSRTWRARAEPGDAVLAIGAGDVDRAPGLLRELLRQRKERRARVFHRPAASRATSEASSRASRRQRRLESVLHRREHVVVGDRDRRVRDPSAYLPLVRRMSGTAWTAWSSLRGTARPGAGST